MVGFCASYKGKFFNGYAKEMLTKDGVVRNYTKEQINNLKKQSCSLKGIKFNCCDYQDIDKNICNFLIYCDIPYKRTTKYKDTNINYDDFYKWCNEMSANNIVLISEYDMPSQFECIWKKETKTYLSGVAEDRIEKLFICKK